MIEGAFAMLDCLGFKGIWRHGQPPEDILGFFKGLPPAIDKLSISKIAGLPTPQRIDTNIAFLSDTAVISCRWNPPPPAPLTDFQKGSLVAIVAVTCIELMVKFLQCHVPLALRGCITYGPHEIDGNFFLGPAIDEAASLAEAAKAAIIWATPRATQYCNVYMHELRNALPRLRARPPKENIVSGRALIEMATVLARFTAQEANYTAAAAKWDALDEGQKLTASLALMEVLIGGARQDLLIMNYPMPITGGSLLAHTLNPFYLLWNEADLGPQFGQLIKPFDRDASIDVLTKRQNTVLFLRRAMETSQLSIRTVRDIWQRCHPGLALFMS